MGPDELMELYRTARTPALEELDGKLTGRMLAVPRAQEPHVKAFKHETANHGHDRKPPVVRNMKDEVREVAPGFYLGLAYLSMGESEHLGCFFGIRKGES